jgi:hypothetical protein
MISTVHVGAFMMLSSFTNGVLMRRVSRRPGRAARVKGHDRRQQTPVS